MKKCSLFLTSALSALLFAGAAYADNGCPEGTTALINPQANTRSCIPLAPNAQGTAPVPIERATEPTATEQAAVPTTKDDAQTRDSGCGGDNAEDLDFCGIFDVGELPNDFEAVPARSVHQPDVEAADSTSSLDTNETLKEKIRAAQIAKSAQRQEKARVAQIAESVRTSGWVLGGGVGFGYTKSFDLCRMVLRVMTGYHFAIPSSDLLSFGLYLNGYVNFEGLVSGDVFVTPNLHIFKGQFRFSTGLGLGTSIMTRIGHKSNDADEYSLADINFDGSKPETDAYFTLAPTVGFDWFPTKKAFFGIDAVLPLMIDSDGVKAGLKFDLHVGYKF